jgi:hypothetical protein
MSWKTQLKQYQRDYYKQAKTQENVWVQVFHDSQKLKKVAKLGIPRDKITLRFLRKGLFTKRVEAEFTPTAEKPALLIFGENYELKELKRTQKSINQARIAWDKKLALNGQHLDFFNLMPTTLNEGYLYLIEADTTYKMLEFQVKQSGELHPVKWKNADKRKESYESTREIQVILPKKGQKRFHIKYSRTQWSAKKIEQLVAKRIGINELPTIFCDGKNGQITDVDHVPYNELVGQFNSSEDQIYGQYLDRQLQLIAIDETKHNSANLKEDRFVILDDIIGCGMDVQQEVDYQTNRLIATVESIKRGQDVRSLERKLAHGQTLKAPSGKHKEVYNMVLLANTIYRMLYSDSESSKKMKGKYGEHVSKRKLEQVLGVERRNILRSWLYIARADLSKIIEDSPDFKNEIKRDKMLSKSDQVLDSEIVRASITNTYLSSDPFFIDSWLGIPKNKHDGPTLASNTRIAKAFSSNIDIPTKKFHEQLASKADWTGKIYGLADKILETTALIIEQKIPIIDTTFEFKSTVNWSADRLNSLGIGSGAPGFIVEQVPSDKIRLRNGGHIKSAGTETFSQIRFDSGTDENLAKMLKESDSWKNLGYSLNIMNFGFVSYQMFNNPNWEKAVSTGTGLLDLTSDLVGVLEARSSVAKEIESLKTLGKRIKLTGAVIGFGLSAYEAYGSYKKDDHNAAAFQAGAAVAFGTSAFLGSAGAVAFSLGPLGWTIIGFTLVVLSIFSLDESDEFVTYFKNIAFSKKGYSPDIAQNVKPWNYNQKFNRQYKKKYEHRNSDSKRKKWSDFERAFVELTEMLTVPKVEVRTAEVVNRIPEIDTRTMGESMPILRSISGNVKVFELKINVGHFTYDKNQLVIKPIFYKKGLGIGNNDDIPSHKVKTEFIPELRTNTGEIKSPAMIKALVTVPSGIGYTPESKILFLCRLKLGEGKYYPYSIEGRDRHIGVFVNTKIIKENPDGKNDRCTGVKLTGKKVKLDNRMRLLQMKN